MLNNVQQKEVRKYLLEQQKLRDKAMKALHENNIKKASLMFNLDARNSEKLSELLKVIN